MRHSLPLDKMSITEKLAAMELLWEDLNSSNDNVPPFSWAQTDFKKTVKNSYLKGKTTFTDLKDAKARIRDATQRKIQALDLEDKFIKIYAVLDCRQDPAKNARYVRLK